MEKKIGVRLLYAVIISASVIGFFIFGLLIPAYGQRVVGVAPEISWLFLPGVIYDACCAIPFFAAMIAAWCIARDISGNNAFCADNVKRLMRISWLSLVEGIWLVVGMIVLTCLNMLFPILFIAMLIIAVTCFALFIFFAALSKLTQSAAALRDENELTV